jgi:integrase
MSHSTSDSSSRKPHPNFPLTLRESDGRWQKKIKGKFYYFTGTAQEALDEWLRVKDDLLAGRKPREKDGAITVLEVCDRFLVAKRRQVDEGSLKQLSWKDYKATCDRIIAHLGKTRAAADLRAEDFEEYRAKVAKNWGLVATSNEVNRVRVVFKYAYDSDLLSRPLKFGPQFKRVPKKASKKHKAKHVAEHGKKLLEAADIRSLIDEASPPMKAMILLAINTGMGNSDVGHLPLSAINLTSGWLDYPRPKTGEDRRCLLWQETLDAIREYLPKRPMPKTAEAEKLLFVTRCGDPWAKDDSFDNPIHSCNKHTHKVQTVACFTGVSKLFAAVHKSHVA